MPGLCGLLNHSCERRWRRAPLPAGACPLVGFFVIGFSCNANALASVLWYRLFRCPTARAAIFLPPGGAVSPQNHNKSRPLVKPTLFFAQPPPETPGRFLE